MKNPIFILMIFFKWLFPSRRPIGKIIAVHESNIEDLLQRLELLDDFNKGNLTCAFCGSLIKKENLQCIFSQNGEIKLCCDELECYYKISEITEVE